MQWIICAFIMLLNRSSATEQISSKLEILKEKYLVRKKANPVVYKIPVYKQSSNNNRPKLPVLTGSKDWRGILTTPIKDQGVCGTCWATAGTEQVESDAARLLGVNYVLSPQLTIDCYDRTACQGGTLYDIYNYFKSGVPTAHDYPYTSGYKGDAGTCKAAPLVVRTDGYGTIYTEYDMARYVLKHGPLNVAIEAIPLFPYTGGVYSKWNHGDIADHAIQIVGVNLNAPQPYWIVRNSWSSSWGENGTARVLYGNDTLAISQVGAIYSNVVPFNTPSPTAKPTQSPPIKDYHVCATLLETNEAELLTCQNPNDRITAVDFYSFGNPSGACGAFTKGSCSFGSPLSLYHCVGEYSCTVVALSSLIAGPCGDPKLSVQFSCARPRPSSPPTRSPTRPTVEPTPAPTAPTMKPTYTPYACGYAKEGHDAVIKCADPRANITSVLFYSFGNAWGDCGSYFKGNCDGGDVTWADDCIGLNSCVISARNGDQGGDPCPGYPKWLKVEVACATGFAFPTFSPTTKPTMRPSSKPRAVPSLSPTRAPSRPPTKSPRSKPTKPPTKSPTSKPTKPSSKAPIKAPSVRPTKKP